jgi:nucleotide-binding universal stress UspA family protein
MADSLHARGIDADWEVRQGVVGPTITQFAKQASYDLVALSTHGRSGIGRLIFGSVADHVLRKSGLPILLVKPDMKGEGE